MNLQGLTVIFIIIILPISIILSAYTQNQITTINLQTSYDSKLDNATYDAMKAYQINAFNSDTSNIVNSKIIDIEASVNTFFNSIATNFNMAGYNSDILKDYVPALVYTMYDGYYIYSPYSNTEEDNQKTYGLKPYIYYSCRYKKYPKIEDDFVITYSLDNYITIQGRVNGKTVNDSGYLLTNVTKDENGYKYRDVSICSQETLSQDVIYIDNNGKNKNINDCAYKKINGVKYYYDNNEDKVFSIINGKRHDEPSFNKDDITKNENAKKYYEESLEFKERLIDDYNLLGLSTSSSGKNIYGNYKIFEGLKEGSSVSIEEPNSNFNQHRLAVIRNSIETNLSSAISNYNNYLGSEKANFQMPKLKEDEWDKLLNNISIISFLQGLNIGGKIYNGYSIINNNKNEEVVSEDSIYIAADNYYYNVKGGKDIENSTNMVGILNIDFEKRSVIDKDGDYYYYFPKKQLADYKTIVSMTDISNKENVYEYLNESGNETLASIYYTALGRERYGIYRTNNK